ncbi:MAG: hypothetical protein WBC51_13245 [Vicinamibacterales bacterium]
MDHKLIAVFVVGLAIGAAGHDLRAQTAPPTLQKLTPTGVQRGTQVTVTIVGTNIGDATRLIFSEPGFTSKITAVKEVPIEKMVVPKGVVRTDAPIDDKARRFELTVVVTIAKDVPHGMHGFRLHTPLGVSNQLRFAVSSLAETKEDEPNDPAKPQAVTLPAALVGALSKPGDVDAYRFAARAGDEMVFQVVARPLGARLDSVIRLLDASGNLVAENNDLDLNRDSVLTWKFKDSGTYSIAIEDLEHGGGADGFGYRIYAGVLPYLTSVFPLGLRSGAAGDVAVTGVNLGADSVRVSGEPIYPGGRTVPVAVTAARGPALNRKAISLGPYPDAPEREPNSDMALAHPLTVPSSVNGRIWTEGAGELEDGRTGRGDQDLFKFTATKGQKLVFEITAQQLGSPLDSVIEVLDALGRPVPRALARCLARTEIALNDPDSTRRSIRLLTWNELAINDYLMVGDELLQVASLPTHPDDDLQLKSYRGIRSALLDTSPRNHSVGEAVYKVSLHAPGTRLEANGMPVFQIDYVNDDGGTRFGGKDSRLHFEAPADGTYFLRLRDVRGLEGERFAYRLTVREPAPDYSVAFDPKSFNIPRGGRVSVTVTAERKDGFSGPIDVEFVDLPEGLTSPPGRIPADADTTVLMIAAAPEASLHAHKARLRTLEPKPVPYEVSGVAMLTLAARASIDGKLVSHEAERMDPLDVVALAPRPDLVVTTTADRVELPAGGQVTLTVNVERRNGFTGRVPISVINLPHGVRVDDIGLNGVMITEEETSRTVHLVAESWVEPISQPIVVVGRVEVNSPLRNESAAPPVELVVKRVATSR